MTYFRNVSMFTSLHIHYMQSDFLHRWNHLPFHLYRKLSVTKIFCLNALPKGAGWISLTVMFLQWIILLIPLHFQNRVVYIFTRYNAFTVNYIFNVMNVILFVFVNLSETGIVCSDYESETDTR